ncbi:MAG: carbon-nitrogen hydrolase family protein, partial [Candidatus Thiodiazotropha sp. (ex Cardiolucina cf. quadrata)]|nr:carbon-nitrogen hydrolase family protein [Candidatus Thiodiazotropha sp. (ex Cardiolucina cf. quadrata)]
MSGKNNKVAAIQMASNPNVSANLLEAERLISAASDSGAGLVVLPENFAFKGEHDRDMLTLCEDVEDGPLQGFL